MLNYAQRGVWTIQVFQSIMMRNFSILNIRYRKVDRIATSYTEKFESPMRALYFQFDCFFFFSTNTMCPHQNYLFTKLHLLIRIVMDFVEKMARIKFTGSVNWMQNGHFCLLYNAISCTCVFCVCVSCRSKFVCELRGVVVIKLPNNPHAHTHTHANKHQQYSVEFLAIEFPLRILM